MKSENQNHNILSAEIKSSIIQLKLLFSYRFAGNLLRMV